MFQVLNGSRIGGACGSSSSSLATGISASRSVVLEVLVEDGVVEADGGGVVPVRGEHHALHPGPQRGGQAHGARLAAGVEGGAGEVERAKFAAGPADGRDFGVGCGIVRGGDAVDAVERLSVCRDDDGAERTAAVQDVGRGQLDGFGQESCSAVTVVLMMRLPLLGSRYAEVGRKGQMRRLPGFSMCF